mmetsp:Transcript_1572/g.1932  ORF Transcript_1572/g.1932 Transcript_1572/m.1932 type:complete len:97 (-) Transcript_1572:173-463(-)
MKKRGEVRSTPSWKPGKSIRIPGVQKEGEVRSTSFFHARTAVTKSKSGWIDTPIYTPKPELISISVKIVQKTWVLVCVPTPHRMFNIPKMDDKQNC